MLCKGSGKSSFGPLCPGQCSAQMYVCVSGNLIDGKIFTGTSINPGLAAFDSLPWLPKGCKLNIFIPNAPINVKPGGGGWATHGNLTVACIPRVGILIGHYTFHLSIL